MMAMIGRKTNGGLVMMSSPLMPPPPGRTPDAGVSVAVGVGDDVSSGDGVTPGVGGGGPCNVNVAHGLGCTLTHSLCTPGLSKGRGLSTLVNAPEASLTTVAAMWEVRSQ